MSSRKYKCGLYPATLFFERHIPEEYEAIQLLNVKQLRRLQSDLFQRVFDAYRSQINKNQTPEPFDKTIETVLEAVTHRLKNL